MFVECVDRLSRKTFGASKIGLKERQISSRRCEKVAFKSTPQA
jgi:hypothetical protein